jgi:diguanylate cyclase (GGDEF)-like protein
MTTQLQGGSRGLRRKTLLALSAAAIPSLAVAVLLGLRLMTAVGGAEKSFDHAMSASRQLSEIRVVMETEHGLVARIPGELDLTKVDYYSRQITDLRLNIDTNLARLGVNKKIVEPATAAEIARVRDEMSAASDAILASARSFAQTTALAQVDGAFEPAYGSLAALLDAIQSNVHSIAEGARHDLRRSSDLAWVVTPLALIAALGALVFGFWSVQRNFVDPVLALTDRLVRMRKTGSPEIGARDDLAVRTDEVGTLARAFEQTMDELAEARRTLIAQSEAEIHVHLNRLNVAIDNMGQGLSMFDAEQKLIVCNRRYAEMYDLGPELVAPGTDLERIIAHRTTTDLVDAKRFAQDSLKAIADRTPWYYVQEMRDGRAVAISYQPMSGGGFVATHEDITERRKAEARMAYMAHHDALTGLFNRARFRQEIEGILDRKQGGEPVAVLYLDLDRFKTVNDTLGHPCGDALLQSVAERLRSCVGDSEILARLGGDEFAVIQTGSQPVDATALAAAIIDKLDQPYEIDGHQVVAGTSIGIAVAPHDGIDPDVLLKKADIALYRAKKDGRGTYRFFEAEMDASMQERHSLELDLRSALAKQEFTIAYQPLMSVKSNQVCGFEALLRWEHPQRGLISPVDFIPLAEETRIIVPIGRWVLKQACLAARTWPDDISVAVNLSPIQFKSGTLVLDVIAALAESGLPANRLELEITEGALLENTDNTMMVLNQLKELGARIAMDDFGTGYSSLGYLRSFPFDKIKIDRSFIRDISDVPESMAIIRAITSLGSSLGILVTAEGVETEEQLRRIQEEGCTEVQGYLFSKPRPDHELGALIARLDGKSLGGALSLPGLLGARASSF